MGRYVPPDLEGTVSHNTASGKGHALGARARKLKTEGILIVRFECPFAIWCTTCDPEQIIGQGVRFNAEKKHVGAYYTTKIWSFRFKHAACGGWIEVRTDPQNAEYVVVEGGRRRDYGGGDGGSLVEDGFRVGSGVSEEEKARLESEGGFAALEKKVADKNEHDSQQKRLDELVQRSEKDWGDPYERSKKLRREFRVGRRQRQDDEKSGLKLQEKYGIGIDLLAPDQLDVERSKLVDFECVEDACGKTSMKPMLGAAPNTTRRSDGAQSKGRGSKQDRGESKVAVQKTSLQSTLQRNTRSAIDPFLRNEESWKREGRAAAKRKRGESEKVAEALPTAPAKTQGPLLVDYDSDSS